MKAKAIVVEPAIVLEMTLREAQVLKCLIGGVEVLSVGVVATCMRDLFKTLSDAGVSTGDESFSDMFKGKLETRPVVK